MKAGRYLIIIIMIVIGISAQAQTVTISGSILNQADAKPVAAASVFLSNTTIGAKSADDGTFTLHNVKSGKYELIITIIGFETYRQKITVNETGLTLPLITIIPKTNMLKEVTIRVDPNHKRNLDWFYERFRTEFLGSTELANDCKILNPDVLDIDYDENTNTITASTSDFLEIENDALGYKIHYLLTFFKYRDISKQAKEIYYEGPALFTEMKGTAQEERRWQKKREEVYEGSARDFLHSVLNNRARENGFRVLRYEIFLNPERPPDTLMLAKIELFKRLKSTGEKRYKDSLSFWTKKYELPDTIRKIVNFPINRENVIEPAGQKGLYALNCNNDWLYITYNKNHNYPSNPALYSLDRPDNTENTLMKFNNQEAFFDGNGVVTNPAAVSFRGIWGRGRVAWLLPSDYEPVGKPVIYSDTVLSRMAARMDSYAASRNTEKVYLHLDKPNYSYGDTIWYKAYTVAGQHHQLSSLSGVLYVELLSPKDSLVTRQIVSLSSGIGWSDIPLPHSLKQGAYRIRAYTRWMRNESPDYFYNQTVRIGGVVTGIVKSNPTEHPDVQFFPEGGELVNGVRSRVAVKAVGVNGLGENIKGTIEDNTGNIVADFTTRHLGMGVFVLIPETGKTYKARINVPGETSYTIDLPKAQQTGYTLAVNNSARDSITIKITTNELTFSQDKEKTFYIIAQSSGKVCYTAQGKLENIVYMAGVEKNKFPTGIAQFTLFSQTGEPIAERIAFIDNSDQLKLNITTDDRTYTTRQKVKIELTAKDSINLSPGSFSVAVINESIVQPEENAESTIENNLLLISELKGYIEQPNYYFTNKSEQAKTDLDVLLLTQGYRRYERKEALAGKTQISAYKPEKAPELKGILSASDGKPVPNGSVTLVSTLQNLARDTMSDTEGRFTFSNLYVTDTAIMVLRARKANNGSNVEIKPLLPDYPQIIPAEKISGSALPTDTTQRDTLKQQFGDYQKQQKADLLKNAKMLKTVNINGIKHPQKPELNNSSNLNGPGHANQVIMYNQLADCVDLAECLNGKMPGVMFQNGKFYLVRNMARSKLINVKGISSDDPMAVIVDGTVFDQKHADPLHDLNTNDVYSIEVLTSGAYLAIYGSSASGGALIITTKRGGEKGTAYFTQAQPNGIITFPFVGLYKAKTFYSPKYEPANNKQLPDNRTTIYWNPNIITDKDGKASIEYFNNDTKGTYRVVVEGIDEDGKLGRAVYRYQVQ